MIRQSLSSNEVGKSVGFRWRGKEVSRLEGFSDGVFAFALTLLVVSLEVPKSFGELLRTMEGFFAFAICFAIMTMIWYSHYKFFRQYGMQDTTTILLNAVLLFVVLFYVYPLKFLFTVVINQLLGFTQAASDGSEFHAGEPTKLMIAYGLGYIAVFAVFTLLHLHALRRRTELELTDYEVFATRVNIGNALVNVGVACISVIVVVVGGDDSVALSGMSYFLIGIAMTIFYYVVGKRRRAQFSDSVSAQP